jgi:hypothetical protein
LAVICGVSLCGSSIDKIVVDKSNPHYFVSGDFLVAVDGMSLIRYFGRSENVIIGRDIEAVGSFSFRGCNFILTVAFEPEARLTQFGQCAFAECSRLTSICIPAQVEHLSDSCFSWCTSLAKVTFEQGSKLTRIDGGAFMECRSLSSFAVPPQLEILEFSVFDCDSLSELIFEFPSRLRQLALPMKDFDCLSIPDSVEVLTGVLRKCQWHNRVLRFGRESRLMTIRFNSIVDCPPGRRVRPTRIVVFVCLSEGALRRLRCSFEAF